MNNPLYFELQVDIPDRAIVFYEKVFDWCFTKLGGSPIDYWRIETSGLAGGMLVRPAPTPPPRSGTNASVISMEVMRFDESGTAIIANGGTEAMPKFAVPGRCWQGYFLDTEGNTFGIFEVDSSAK